MKYLPNYFLLIVAVMLVSGCKTLGDTDYVLKPGDSINHGQKQCKYKVIGVNANQHGCDELQGMEICIERCTVKAKPPCNSDGKKNLDKNPANPGLSICTVTLDLVDCEDCGTSLLDGISSGNPADPPTPPSPEE